ncbi:MAG: response regulator [Bacteroidota bacterium]|nr:response regulator [Bacteroidota bacterium]
MNKTILIADDSNSMRDLVGFTLKSAGYNVIEGVDGVDALRFFDGKEINLVITDLNMPNMDGITLIREIRKLSDYSYTPIVLLTTESQHSKREDAKSAGATGWLVKPFLQDKLLEVVRKVIR